MKSLKISQYQRLVEKWIDSAGSEYFPPTTNACMLAEEVGEVSRIISRSFGDQVYKQGEEPADVPAALADELADILFVVTCIANQQGIDLTEAIVTNFDKKTRRDKHRYRPDSPGRVTH